MIRGGSEKDKAREEQTAPSATPRALAHKRRVFVSSILMLFNICFSLDLIDMLLFLCAYQVVRTVQYRR